MNLTLLLLGIAAAPAQEYQGYPVADAFVSSDVPNRNTGGWNWMAVTWWPSMPTPWYEESYLKFDLSSIPLHSTITSAELQLYFHDGVDTGNCLCSRVTGDWTENGVTWSNRPGSDTSGQVPFAVDTHPRNIVVSPIRIVQDWVNGTPNFGFCLRPEGIAPEYTVSLRSREFYDSTQIPMLNVTYIATGCQEESGEIRDVEYAVVPNPAHAACIIRASQPIRAVKIYDIAGKLVRHVDGLRRGPARSARVTLDGVPAGVYLIRVHTVTGDFSRRLIVE